MTARTGSDPNVSGVEIAPLPIRPDLLDAEPYHWEEGLPEGRLRRFDMNLSPVPPAWYGRAVATLGRVPVHTYPDATYLGLRDAVAEHTGFDSECVVLTGGADEAVQLCALLALRPGDEAHVRRPFYSWYGNATRLAGAKLVHEPSPAVRLWWSCVPHNPTGADATEDDLRERDGLVVIDQAYVEFGGRDLSPLVRDRPNTVVVRTFSKAFALAGARIGYVLAPPAIARRLDAIRPPASISSFSVALAGIALREAGEMRARAAATVAERDRMATALRSAGLGVRDSCANFLLVDVGEPAAAVSKRLLEQGLVVRTFADPLLAEQIRISPATPADDDALLAALGAAVESPPTVGSARIGTAERRTAETDVRCRVALDGSGQAAVSTGIGMLDHMLTALAAHSLIDVELTCTGDLWVDEHHTVEDVAIVLGQALDGALGDRSGIARFGDARAPLDEALAHATVDLGGRGVAAIELPFAGDRIGALPGSLVPHFFDTLARSGRLGIHLSGAGVDDHHVLEAAFKALARALRAAVAEDPRRAGAIPSTKGSL
jgi:histidinol-phosphate/aromatic aminotransferase/cobyric acid decarboxylase-like protein/imidazoleglycerol phosphate dehydratase HisB